MFDDFYGLSARPFQLTPDPAFYFESLTHRKALSYLGYGLAQGEGFVVITGEVGAGKSTLVAHLMATIDPSRLTAAQVVTSRLDGEEIVHVVAQAFGLLIEGHDKASALGAIEDFLHEEARAGRRCLLIVDESQNLEIGALEELRMLSNFQLGAHPLLQTLLLGQPEFRQILGEDPALEQLRQRVIAMHHLEPMQAKEVQPYIEHRMKCVGWSGNPAFDQRVFAEIHAATGGVPRRINQIVNRLLLLGAVDERTRIDGAMVSQVLREMVDDGAVGTVTQVAAPASEVAKPLEVPLSAPVDHAHLGAIEALRAETAAALAELRSVLSARDVQLEELQQAVLEVAGNAERDEDRDREAARQIAALNAQVSALEGRLIEQERTIRHTLTMLIEWIETGEGARAAA